MLADLEIFKKKKLYVNKKIKWIDSLHGQTVAILLSVVQVLREVKRSDKTRIL